MDITSIKEIKYLPNPHRIGKGGYGTIYLVEHPDFHYKRALKVINSGDVTEDEKRKTWIRFLRECHVLFQLGNGSHPNIVRIHQITKFNGHPAMEIEYVQGDTLMDYITKNKYIETTEIFRFINQIVSAVAFCHVDVYRYNVSLNDKRIKIDDYDGNIILPTDGCEESLIKDYSFIHADIHPKNIMRRTVDGSYVLLDFGISWQNEKPVNSIMAPELGFQEYRCPEYRQQHKNCTLEEIEINNIRPEKNWDVYSLGTILYELLTGETPKKDMSALTPSHIYELRKFNFETIYNGKTYISDYPETFNEIILKCVGSNPNNRYKDAKELFNELNAAIINYNPTDELESQIKTIEHELENQKEENLGKLYQLKEEFENEKKEIILQYENKIKKINEEALTLDKVKRKQKSNGHFTLGFLCWFLIICFGVVAFFHTFSYEDIAPLKEKIISQELFSSNLPEIDQDTGNRLVDTVYIVKKDTVKITIPQIVKVPQKEIEYKSFPEDQRRISQLEKLNQNLQKDKARLEAEINRWEQAK